MEGIVRLKDLKLEPHCNAETAPRDSIAQKLSFEWSHFRTEPKESAAQ